MKFLSRISSTWNSSPCNNACTVQFQVQVQVLTSKPNRYNSCAPQFQVQVQVLASKPNRYISCAVQFDQKWQQLHLFYSQRILTLSWSEESTCFDILATQCCVCIQNISRGITDPWQLSLDSQAISSIGHINKVLKTWSDEQTWIRTHRWNLRFFCVLKCCNALHNNKLAKLGDAI